MSDHPESTREPAATRDGFGKALKALGEMDPRVVALTVDLAESTRCHWFKQQYPERFVEVGIGEQNMMSVAAGLAHVGKIPFACSFSVFNPGRNWDQLRVSVCYSDHNVKVVGTHAGLTVGEDGATHQALEDIAITRVIPNLTVLVPSDANQAYAATIAAAKHQGPVYLRLGRAKMPVISDPEEAFEIGRARRLREGTDVTIIACGIMVHESLQAAQQLEKEGISARVVDCASIKPLDETEVIAAAEQTGAIVTAEEHQVMGGLGGAVAEVCASNAPVPIERVGVHDSFGESGPAAALLDAYGLRAIDIADAARRAIARKTL